MNKNAIINCIIFFAIEFTASIISVMTDLNGYMPIEYIITFIILLCFDVYLVFLFKPMFRKLSLIDRKESNSFLRIFYPITILIEFIPYIIDFVIGGNFTSSSEHKVSTIVFYGLMNSLCIFISYMILKPIYKNITQDVN